MKFCKSNIQTNSNYYNLFTVVKICDEARGTGKNHMMISSSKWASLVIAANNKIKTENSVTVTKKNKTLLGNT